MANLSFDNADNQVAIVEASGIEPLVALAGDGTDAQKSLAADALRNLAFESDDNQVAIAQAAGIAPLVALALDGTDEQKTTHSTISTDTRTTSVASPAYF